MGGPAPSIDYFPVGRVSSIPRPTKFSGSALASLQNSSQIYTTACPFFNHEALLTISSRLYNTFAWCESVVMTTTKAYGERQHLTTPPPRNLLINRHHNWIHRSTTKNYPDRFSFNSAHA